MKRMNINRRMRVMVIAILVTLTGCTGMNPGADGSPTLHGATPDPTGTPDRSNFQVPTEKPSPSAGETVSGVLGADAVEGGCAYLETADGTRYEVLYPGGWEVRASPLELTDPDGTVVATGGETITVRGERADDMASICQLGPMFRATEVVSVE